MWEGDTLDVIRSFSEDAKEDLGHELDRVQNGERPLKSRPMGAVLPGCFELRDEDKDFWYRVIYTQMGGEIHVLHCFRKKTNQTSQGDIDLAKRRLSQAKQRAGKK